MRFSEWVNKLDEQHKKVSGIPLAEIAEAMSVDGSSIVVSVGKKYGVEIDGNSPNIRYLRPFYTNHKDEFANLLESITEQVRVVAEATDVIMEAVTYDSVPELVMDRIEGKQEAQDSAEMLQGLATKRLRELWAIFDREYVTSAFQLEFENIAGKKLMITQGSSISWDTLTVLANSRTGTLKPEECLYFLANYETIKAKVEQVRDALLKFEKAVK